MGYISPDGICNKKSCLLNGMYACITMTFLVDIQNKGGILISLFKRMKIVIVDDDVDDNDIQSHE